MERSAESSTSAQLQQAAPDSYVSDVAFDASGQFIYVGTVHVDDVTNAQTFALQAYQLNRSSGAITALGVVAPVRESGLTASGETLYVDCGYNIMGF